MVIGEGKEKISKHEVIRPFPEIIGCFPAEEGRSNKPSLHVRFCFSVTISRRRGLVSGTPSAPSASGLRNPERSPVFPPCLLFLSISPVFRTPRHSGLWVPARSGLPRPQVPPVFCSDQTDFFAVPWVTTGISTLARLFKLLAQIQTTLAILGVRWG